MFKAITSPFQSKSPSEQKVRDSILTDRERINPFPGRPATATPSNPPIKLFGRQKEYEEILNVILSSTMTEDRPLLIVQGETGMGKSALNSYIFNEIRNGTHDKSNRHVYAAFIEAYGEAQDFGLLNFYQQIMRSLEKYLILRKLTLRVVQMIGRIIYNEDSQEFRNLFGDWDVNESPQSTLERLNNREHAGEFISNLIDALGLFYPPIQNQWPEIDSGFLKVLLYSQSATKSRVKAIESIKTGKRYEDFSVSTNGQAKDMFHTLMSLIGAIEPNSTLTLFIDQLEELFETIDPKKISMKFFTLLLTLRQVPNLSIVLSGNNEAYKHLTDNLVGDSNDHLEQWHRYLHLTRLPQEQVCRIVHHLLDNLWQENTLSTDPNYPYYPLSAKTIAYLYEKHDRNLRTTLIGLHDIFNQFKDESEVTDLTDPIASIGRLNIIHDPLRLPLNIQRDFSQALVSDTIQDNARSKIPEIAIFNLFLVLQNSTNYISEVKKSSKMPKSGKMPDISYKLGGNLFHSDERIIGIEVKSYRKSDYIPQTIVEKTLVLLKKNDLDYAVWITNVKLDQSALATLTPDQKERHLRITPTTKEEQAYLYWGYIFEAAMQRKPTLEEATGLLEKIGIPLIVLREPSNLISLEQERSIGSVQAPITDSIKTESTSLYDYAEEEELTVKKVKVEEEQINKPQLTKQVVKPQRKKPISKPVETPTVSPIGLDVHDKMKTFISHTVDSFIAKGRKQLNKITVYHDFLSSGGYSSHDAPESEFLEVVETMALHNSRMRTTLKLIKLQY
ncbi:MAG: hypothetical protein HeimC2_28490 [Candidatus Heimdallarchaeota archaeon LC_2]|nr:MAG: hypothetical protein HeimC2_28490 [Candidatus Heimdallarchaeota archaeon LC_2]